MRLQVLDDSVRFACGGCTFCCNQTYRVLIEADKAQALDACDFSKYPQLAGKALYHELGSGDREFYAIAKLAENRCIFCDTDDLCIIHKELGPEAKPHMCQQFPFLVSKTPIDDRLSASYGCPAVQQCQGTELNEQASAIAKLVAVTDKPVDFDACVPLDPTCDLTWPESEALFERMIEIFGPGQQGDLWTRFGHVLALLVAVREQKMSTPPIPGSSNELIDLLRSNEPLPHMPDVPPVLGWSRTSQAPMPVRFLFAATMYPDAVSTECATSPSLFKRLSLIPKLIALSKLSGVYASRILERNISVGDVLEHDVCDRLDDESTELLLRYYRSRFWQRMLAGTRLSVIAGVHQHIHDLNAIIFMARAEAYHKNVTELNTPLIQEALRQVEFHIANQRRMYESTLKGWLRAQLNHPALAFQSLRLMALKRERPKTEVAGENGAAQDNASTSSDSR